MQVFSQSDVTAGYGARVGPDARTNKLSCGCLACHRCSPPSRGEEALEVALESIVERHHGPARVSPQPVDDTAKPDAGLERK